MLVTSIDSLSPSTPGRRQQIPRMTSRTGTPAALASYNLSMMPRSWRLFILAVTPEGRPLRAASVSASMRALKPSRKWSGATNMMFEFGLDVLST